MPPAACARTEADDAEPRRLAAVGLAIVLIIGVGYGILSSAREALGPPAVTLHGLIGSEKLPFFSDARGRCRAQVAAASS
ncbi:MAG: hypothetical protein WKF78_11985 [Candidatus Limnocylindrales bacterium]